MNGRVREAVDHFHELLHSGYLESSREVLQRETEARGLQFLKHDLVTVLRPVFLEAAVYRDAIKAASIVSRALTRLHRRLARDPALRAELELEEGDELFVQAEPDGPTEAWGRLDGFIGPDGVVRFLEFNSMASGAADRDEILETFLAMPILSAFRTRFPVMCEMTQSRTVESFLRAYRNRGGTGLPRVAIVSDPTADRELQWLEARIILDRLALEGVAIRRGLPAQVGVRDGVVALDGWPVDVILTDDWRAFVRAMPFGSPFWKAVRERKVWLGKSWNLRLLRGDKREFVMLSDPRYASLFDLEERAAIARHVPWTRRLREGQAEHRGVEIDLVEHVVLHREDLVLKPANDFGGAGIVLGWEVDAATWEQAIRAALAGRPHVIQERAQAVREPFASFSGGALQIDDRTVDFNPFIWNESSAGAASSRVSRTALMNLTAGGGSEAPIFVLTD
ncbi:MAG: hypothetical protein ACLQVI_12955 [Polyangiaceae bacterium]